MYGEVLRYVDSVALEPTLGVMRALYLENSCSKFSFYWKVFISFKRSCCLIFTVLSSFSVISFIMSVSGIAKNCPS